MKRAGIPLRLLWAKRGVVARPGGKDKGLLSNP